LANLYVQWGASPPDPPLRVAIVRSVGLIVVVGRLTIVVCLLDASMGVKCGPGLQAWSAVYNFAGLQVHILPLGQRWRYICVCIIYSDDIWKYVFLRHRQ